MCWDVNTLLQVEELNWMAFVWLNLYYVHRTGGARESKVKVIEMLQSETNVIFPINGESKISSSFLHPLCVRRDSMERKTKTNNMCSKISLSRGRKSFPIDIFTIELYYPLFIQFLLLSLRSIRQFSFFFSIHFYTTYNLSLLLYKSVLDNDIKEQFILCPRWKNEIILSCSTVGVFFFFLGADIKTVTKKG